MKKADIFSKFLAPLLLILLGLVLLLSPDSASALIALILGWVMIAVAVGCGIAALVSPAGLVGKVACAIVFAAAGGWLHAHPLMLASFLGRFCGLFLWISSIQSIRRNRVLGKTSLLPWITSGVGIALLIFLPLSVSRLVFSLAGLAVLIAGTVMLLDALRPRKHLEAPDDPNIIDAL